MLSAERKACISLGSLDFLMASPKVCAMTGLADLAGLAGLVDRDRGDGSSAFLISGRLLFM
jgi:hypothetical protein